MKLVNSYKKIRQDWYSWVVSIEGTSEELDEIKYVTYFLHETFSNPRIVSKNKTNNFSRKLYGWGEFEIKAVATLNNGDTKISTIWLDLGFNNTKDEKEKFDGVFS